MGKRRRRMLVTAAVLLFMAPIALDAVTVKVARDALSSSGFERQHTALPSEFGIAYTDVAFVSDGIRLAAWWMPAFDANAPPGRTTVILVHGHSAEMGKIVRHWAPNLHAAGYNILAFDLRNHGASGNTTKGYVTYGVEEAHDVLAAHQWVRDNAALLSVDPDHIVWYGESMGAASVLNAAATQPVGLVGIISDSSYASFAVQAMLDGEDRGYPGFMVDMVLARMDELATSPPSLSRPDHAIRSLGTPLLLAHCTDDGRLSDASLDVLAAAAVVPATIWHEPCATARPDSDHHVDAWRFTSYNATVRQFLAGLP